MSLVTIILLLKNAEKYLPEQLEKIFSQNVSFDYEILAIDSGSKDRTQEILRANPAVQVIQITPGSFNHGETRNLGARNANKESKYLVYLTQDAIPSDNRWLANLVAPLMADEKLAGAFSRHIPRPNASPSLVRQMTTVWQTGGLQSLKKNMPEDDEEYLRNRFYYIYFSNTSSAINRNILEKYPFMKVNFAEDAVWADAVIRAGYTVQYEPASAVIHSHDYSLLEQFRQNVDHAAAMNELFHPANYQSSMSWWRQFRSIPRQVWRDWFFICKSTNYIDTSLQQKILFMIKSPFWQLASSMGAFVGAHLDRYPDSIRGFLSRQKRIQAQ